MKTRAQAALEFLSTYGFAFLIILVMIGALSYFGVLSPGNLLPDRCNLNPEFSCNDFIIEYNGGNGTLKMNLQNNRGETVSEMNALTLRSQYLDSETLLCGNDENDYNATSASSPVWTNVRGGNVIDVRCPLAQNSNIMPARGEKVRISFETSYNVSGGSFSKSLRGDVFATVQ